MKLEVNGEAVEVTATTVAEALVELGFGVSKVATALNGQFLPAGARAGWQLCSGDRLEVLAPMQGG